MIQLPDRMPTHRRNEIARDKTWTCREMGPDGHEVVSNGVGHSSLHEGRGKLEEQAIVVGQPRHQTTVIGRPQARMTAHGPRMLLAMRVEEGEGTGYIPALQGLSTLGGGYCHNSFPMLSPI